MAKIFVLGVYDCPPSQLFEIDLVRYIGLTGHKVAGIVYRPSANSPLEPGLDRPLRPAGGRFILRSGDFNAPATVEAIRAQAPDLLVYAGGRDILRAPLLAAAPLGCIGGHYGRLPEIRGMATVEWSTLLDVPPTVAVQRISPGIDTGDVLMQAVVPLRPGDDFAAIRARSYLMTKTMLALAAEGLVSGRITGVAQHAGSGRQYFRMHGDLLAAAERALAHRLERLQ